MLSVRQEGPGSSDLVLTNKDGRIRLDGDEVADVVKHLVADETYREWIEEELAMARAAGGLRPAPERPVTLE